jgi:Tfp pilus assembly protein PilN
MARLSFRKASEVFDVSRPTLSKARKAGKISAEKDERGTWLIEESELARLYRRRVQLPGKSTDDLSSKNTPLPDTLNAPEQAEIDRLKEQLAEAEKRAAIAEALAQERAQHIEDLRLMLPAPGNRPRRKWWAFGKEG